MVGHVWKSIAMSVGPLYSRSFGEIVILYSSWSFQKALCATRVTWCCQWSMSRQTVLRVRRRRADLRKSATQVEASCMCLWKSRATWRQWGRTAPQTRSAKGETSEYWFPSSKFIFLKLYVQQREFLVKEIFKPTHWIMNSSSLSRTKVELNSW